MKTCIQPDGLKRYKMTHIENIKKLFSKDFVESPLLESFEVGKIYLSSGKLVACDPLITNDMLPFSAEFPKGILCNAA
jgi:hypothetical protein